MDSFFNDTATTEIYTLSLHDALPICRADPPDSHRPTARRWSSRRGARSRPRTSTGPVSGRSVRSGRSEEHTSELQSRQYLVCRLLLEKKNLSLSYLYPLFRPASRTLL